MEGITIAHPGCHGPRKRIWERVLSNLQDLSFHLLPITLTRCDEENARRVIQDGSVPELTVITQGRLPVLLLDGGEVVGTTFPQGCDLSVALSGPEQPQWVTGMSTTLFGARSP